MRLFYCFLALIILAISPLSANSGKISSYSNSQNWQELILSSSIIDISSCDYTILEGDVECTSQGAIQEAAEAWNANVIAAFESCASSPCGNIQVTSDFDWANYGIGCEFLFITFTITDDCNNTLIVGGIFYIWDVMPPDTSLCNEWVDTVFHECTGTAGNEAAFAALVQERLEHLTDCVTDACQQEGRSGFNGGTIDIEDLGLFILEGCGENYTYGANFILTDNCFNSIALPLFFITVDNTPPDLSNCDLSVLGGFVECSDVQSNEAAAVAWDLFNREYLASCASDLCGEISVESDFDFGNFMPDCGNSGTLSVIYTIRDECENEISFNVILQIYDFSPPLIDDCNVQDLSNVHECSGPVANEVAAQAWDLANINALEMCALDACGDFIVTSDYDYSNLIPDCGGTGTLQVTYRIEDACGNSVAVQGEFQIEDTTPPVAQCKNAKIYLNNQGEAVLNPSMVDNGSEDACSPITMSLSESAFSCDDLGLQEVVLTVTDQCNLSATCIAIVEVIDGLKPKMVCSDLELFLDEGGTPLFITLDQVDAGSSDNCTIVNFHLSQSLFDCKDIGINVLKLTATDQSGNSNECLARVVVRDTFPPFFTFIPEDITVYCEDPGYVFPEASDNCPEAGVYLGQEYYEWLANPEGAYILIRIWIAQDKTGNTVSHKQQITVLPGGEEWVYCPDDIELPPSAVPVQVFWNAPYVDDVCLGKVEMTQIVGSESGSYFNPNSSTAITYEYINQSGKRYQCTFNVRIPRDQGRGYQLIINSPPPCSDVAINTCIAKDLGAPHFYSLEWLPVSSGQSSFYPFMQDANLTILGDGSAVLRGSWQEVGGMNGWEGEIWLDRRRTYNGWISAGGMINNVLQLGDPTLWDYFELDASRSYLLGTGGNTGIELTLRASLKLPKFGFQMGDGANGYSEGMGFWMTFSGGIDGNESPEGEFILAGLLNCLPSQDILHGAEVVSLDGFDYPVVWSNGQAGPILEGVQSGLYSVTVSDQNGSTYTYAFHLNAPEDCESYYDLACREKNASLSAKAVQSSTYMGAVASRAIDGNEDGDFANGSVASTLAGGSNFWQIRLDDVMPIETIRIWPRTDCCEGNPNPFYLFVADYPISPFSNWEDLVKDPEIMTIYHSGNLPAPYSTPIDRTGQYVRIQMTDGGRLDLAEVEVLVCEAEDEIGRLIDSSPNRYEESTQLSLKNDAILHDLKIWPQPAGNEINIDLNMDVIGRATISINHITGNVLFREVMDGASQYRIRVDMRDWSPGIYVVVVSTAVNHSTMPLIIQR